MMDEMLDGMTPEAFFEYLHSLPKPKPTRCSPEIRQWYVEHCLPTLKAQALSELQRNDGVSPKLVLFRDNGGMAVVDVAKLYKNWGDNESKNRTAHAHQLGALMPSVKASVFAVEAWCLRGAPSKEMTEAMRHGLKDHPDRTEVLIFQMIHLDQPTNTVMQLSSMVEIIKVFSANRDAETSAGTKLGDETISDPMGEDELVMKGRFIVGSGEAHETDDQSDHDQGGDTVQGRESP